jgi:hypothetical protein
MRLKKPTRAIIDQVRITREGNDAIIDYADAGIAGTRLTIGPDIATMTDRDIIDVFNGILACKRRSNNPSLAASSHLQQAGISCAPSSAVS